MVADVDVDVSIEWPVEQIPPDAWLFRRIHKNSHTPDGKPHRGGFKDGDGEASVDWAKYSTAKECRDRGPQGPQNYAIVRFRAQAVPEHLGIKLEHRPVRDNRAHCEILGDLSTKVRTVLWDACELVIPLDAPIEVDPPNP